MSMLIDAVLLFCSMSCTVKDCDAAVFIKALADHFKKVLCHFIPSTIGISYTGLGPGVYS